MVGCPDWLGQGGVGGEVLVGADKVGVEEAVVFCVAAGGDVLVGVSRVGVEGEHVRGRWSFGVWDAVASPPVSGNCLGAEDAEGRDVFLWENDLVGEGVGW